ncbi:MAG TPA: cupin domain-containing protein [Candidatus Limnocylindrales bacterium]|nr:cupin domain-containing protein [Candidatus Limnocylindrales bacterium]
MSGVESISLDTPQETRTFPLGHVQLVTVGGSTVGRFTFEPGWRWSTSVKPIVGTDQCENHHVGFAVSGRMNVIDTAGLEKEIGPGEAYDIAPGHDAWIVGNDTFVGLEFKSAAEYAKPK